MGLTQPKERLTSSGADGVRHQKHVGQSRRAPFAPARSEPSKLIINKGDTVTHKRFGKGVVLSAAPMGNDALLEIAFEEGGTRKLMRNSAGAFMSLGG
jgi:DNA helicase-2/ATP-dependent DNA helicase PcrA